MSLSIAFLSSTLLLAGNAGAQNSPPVADAGPDQSIYVGNLTILEGSATDADNNAIIDWLWTIEAAPAGSSPYFSFMDNPRPVFEADVAGDYLLSLIAFDGLAWSTPAYVTIHVAEILPPEAIADADVTSGVAPLTVNFDGSGSYDPQGGTLTFQWDFGDGSGFSTEMSPTHTYDFPGVFDATLTVSDELSQIDTDSIRITVTSPSNILLSASDSGRYSTEGFHDPEDTDYGAVVGGTRSFFVFDLTSITDTRPILSSTLTLDTGTVSGGTFGGITYTLYDVTTPVETLVEGGDELTVIYDDLGSGVPYSAATEIEPGTSSTEISVPLLPAGVAAVENARGGMIAIGGGPTGLGGNLAFGGTDVSGAVLTIELSNPVIVTVSDFAAAYGCIFPDSNYAEFSDFDDDGDVDGNDLAEFTASFE